MPELDPLTDRLERLRRLMDQAATRATEASRDAPMGARSSADSPANLNIEELVDGETVTVGGSSCFVKRSVLAIGHRHGRFPLGMALSIDAPAIHWLAGASGSSAADLRGAVFLDIETTGLSHGTGTLAFLVGLATFEDNALLVDQYLMRSPQEETALLELVSGAAHGRELVVSFNGKAFDVPILETRFTLSRRRCPLPYDHVDLLMGARRVWRTRLESCRLSELERQVLGVTRLEDVPGWLVPQLYFDYLRTGDARNMVAVLDHNLLDVLSLVTLAGRLGTLYQQPHLALEDDPHDLVALGKAFERWPHSADCEDRRLSSTCYTLALQHGLTETEMWATRLRLACLHKRRREWPEAVAHWQSLAEVPNRPVKLAALVELAKHAEHQTRDYERAYEHTQEALADAAKGSAEQARLEHRLARLRRRMAREEATRRADTAACRP